MSQNSSPLRFAIMLQDESLKQWQYDVIEKLVVSGVAIPVLLILNEDNAHKEKDTVSHSKPNILFRLYEKFFLRKKSLANVHLPDCLMHTERIRCTTEKKGKFSEYFSDQDMQHIRDHHPDFILRFGFSIIRGEILNVPTFGVWSFHHSDEKVVRGGPAGFWEVFEKHRVNGVILQRLTNHLDGGIILKKRFYKTILHDCAFHIHHVLSDSTDMPLQVCRDILNDQAQYFNHSPSASLAKVYKYPSVFIMLLFPMKQFFRRIAYNCREILIHEKWAIGYCEMTPEQLIAGEPLSLQHSYTYSSSALYPADPFMITDNGHKSVVFEKYSYQTGKAKLAILDIDEEKGFHSERILSDSDTHYSFPFIVEDNGTQYLMPEQIEKKRVDLYRVDLQLNTMLFEQTILDIPLADPVLFKHHEKWYLFGSPAGLHSNNKLLLFTSQSLFGPYVSHPQNPIVVDPRGSRMAGQILTIHNVLYRFAQVSHVRYGKCISVFAITELSETSFAEEWIREVDPVCKSNYRLGLHTISVNCKKIVFDGKKYIFSLSGILLRVKQKIKKPPSV